LTEYSTPLNPTRQQYWEVTSAVACGPRLIQGGKIKVSDRDERLAHAAAVARTFVGYSVENGKPRRLVLGVGMAMTFGEAAGFLDRYFRKYHGTGCAEAMCLDGGASSQLVYQEGSSYVEARQTLVTVPTAVVVEAGRR
jgi:exopolysaccharide biosynthesis protein